MTKAEFETFVTEWHALFPQRKEVDFVGYLRGKPKDCIKKMLKFCKENPEYTKDTIFAATKMYLEEKKSDGYLYLSRPYYFINKLDRGSMLDEYCERFLAGEKPKISNDYEAISDFI